MDDVTWRESFNGQVTLDIEVKPNDQGKDEMRIVSNLSEEARKLSWQYKVALLRASAQALAKTAMQIMRENGFDPDSAPVDKSSRH